MGPHKVMTSILRLELIKHESKKNILSDFKEMAQKNSGLYFKLI